jgi:hypothetical protein
MSDISKPEPDKDSTIHAGEGSPQTSEADKASPSPPSADEKIRSWKSSTKPESSAAGGAPMASGGATATPIEPKHSDVSPSTDQGDSQGTQTEPVAATSVPEPLKPATWGVKDPTELWCPASLEGEIGFKQDYQHDHSWFDGFGAGWKIAAATKRGRMHAHHGTFREDALWGGTDESFTFVAVCDGAGSSKLSRIGSEYTVRKLSELVNKELQAHQKDIDKCSKESLPINIRVILHHCVDSVARGLVSLADKSGMEPKDFRCTLLTALHYRHQTGGILLFGNVGDGFLAVKKKGQPAERIGTSDSGAFSGEVTCFMPDPPVSEFYRKSLEENTPIPEEDVEAYILCTDGIEDPFFPLHRNVVGLFDQLFEGYRKPIQDVTYPTGQEPVSITRSEDAGKELLKWLGFEKRGENDDRTIALIYREELALPPDDGTHEEFKELPESQETPIESGKQETARSSPALISAAVLWPMIIGALLVAGALLIGIFIGLKLGSDPKPSFIPGG